MVCFFLGLFFAAFFVVKVVFAPVSIATLGISLHIQHMKNEVLQSWIVEEKKESLQMLSLSLQWQDTGFWSHNWTQSPLYLFNRKVSGSSDTAPWGGRRPLPTAAGLMAGSASERTAKVPISPLGCAWRHPSRCPQPRLFATFRPWLPRRSCNCDSSRKVADAESTTTP